MVGIHQPPQPADRCFVWVSRWEVRPGHAPQITNSQTGRPVSSLEVMEPPWGDGVGVRSFGFFLASQFLKVFYSGFASVLLDIHCFRCFPRPFLKLACFQAAWFAHIQQTRKAQGFFARALEIGILNLTSLETCAVFFLFIQLLRVASWCLLYVKIIWLAVNFLQKFLSPQTTHSRIVDSGRLRPWPVPGGHGVGEWPLEVYAE